MGKKIDNHNVAGPIKVPLEKINGPIDQNALIKRKPDATLIKDLRENGQRNPVLVDLKYRVIWGWRRVVGLQKIGAKTVEILVIQDHLTADDAMRLVALDFVREDLEKEDALAQMWLFLEGTGRLEMLGRNASRGGSAKGDSVIKVLIHCFPYYAPSYIKSHCLVRLRARWQKEFGEKKRSLTGLELKGGELNYLRPRFAELRREKKGLEKDQNKVAERKERIAKLESEIIAGIPNRANLTGKKPAKLAAVEKAIDQAVKTARRSARKSG